MSMILDSRSIGNLVLAEIYTALGLHIKEEPENEELQSADGSPLTTQGRVKLHIDCGRYKGLI